MAEEIVAAWRHDSTLGFLWMVDFSKAYDSIDWRFLWNVLRRRGFPETWVQWVKQCVSTPTFAILVNRRPQGGWIHPQRDISAGLSSSPTSIHSCCGHIGSVHNATLPKRPPRGVSVPWHSWRHPPAARRRRYDLFHPGVLGGRAHTLRHDGYLLGFFRPPTEPSKVVLHWLWTIC